MASRYEEQLPHELEPIAARLRAERVDADPLYLDRLKQRLMTTNTPHYGRLTFMKSRIATLLTIVGLAGGTGGAIAIASHGDHHSQGGASTAQYCNKKGQGHGHGKCKGHHKHHKKCNKKGKGRGNGECKGHGKHHNKHHGKHGNKHGN